MQPTAYLHTNEGTASENHNTTDCTSSMADHYSHNLSLNGDSSCGSWCGGEEDLDSVSDTTGQSSEEDFEELDVVGL